ncbi:IQ and AAA domain-containing protein 1 [Papilio machaon]|uniref:IQ and AAA domain-containing protein 1 n=1 Tax=Papilio machaon TaxID=76193 RepID=A0A194QY98_PAPMA|nr:IQ and AAA domain-containing protein 1 [Papilio machaon]
MASKEYYERWLKIKEDFEKALAADQKIQDLASDSIGIKPQATAIEIVARVYSQYCILYNRLCECYDQMDQVQRRPFIRQIIDTITCRLLELKSSLETVEAFEYTYTDNALKQMLIIPQDVEILCPFFYPFEIRQKEMQYIIDQIFAGNRIGDPTPTQSELELREQQRLEEEMRLKEEKEEEIRRKLALGEDIESIHSEVLSPEEIEKRRLEEEYNRHVNNIQRMERSRNIVRQNTKKINKDKALYLELAGLKKPEASPYMKERAAALIKTIYKRFMEIKREQKRENKVKEKLQMIITSQPKPSQKTELKRVEEIRRSYRQKYHEKWLEDHIKEKAHILQIKEGHIMDDITSEIREWFRVWYNKVRTFDEFPWPEEGGSILVVKGETFTIEEYIEYRAKEDKRLKEEAGNPKTKQQIKAEKLEAKLEQRRIEKEALEKEKKRFSDYRKSRLNPANDPGVFLTVGKQFERLQEAWKDYQTQWRNIDVPDPPLEVIKGYIKELLIGTAYQEVHLQLRPIVDEMMRLELEQLKMSLKNDYNVAGISKPPQSEKRKKPRKPKVPKPEKIPPARMFQELFDEGIIKQHKRLTIDDFWGDRNYAAADMRAVEWTPSFPPPCLGDVREQIRIRCLLTLGSSCRNANRSILLVGPKGSGKKTLVYALATETNSILIDLSPFNVYNKYPGPKNLKKMFNLINKVSRLMQPAIILVSDADKIFYKKVPPEEKMFDPTRLQKDLFKEIVKPISEKDKILVIGTASEPWLTKGAVMLKTFSSMIMFPRSDYGSISYILKTVLMKYHGIDREFNVHSLAQTLRGFDINTIRRAIETVLDGNRIAQLYFKPLEPAEILKAAMDDSQGNYIDPFDYDMFTQWYLASSPWGGEYAYYMMMLESQLTYKLKEEKKKKK